MRLIEKLLNMFKKKEQEPLVVTTHNLGKIILTTGKAPTPIYYTSQIEHKKRAKTHRNVDRLFK